MKMCMLFFLFYRDSYGCLIESAANIISTIVVLARFLDVLSQKTLGEMAPAGAENPNLFGLETHYRVLSGQKTLKSYWAQSWPPAGICRISGHPKS